MKIENFWGSLWAAMEFGYLVWVCLELAKRSKTNSFPLIFT